MSLSQWKILGEGAYNKTYVDEKKEFVLKIIKDQSSEIGKIMDDPERSVRLWNEINPHLPEAKLFSDPQYGNGWICPYIEGKQASDEEISKSLITIYTKTSRIITDGPVQNNFKRTPSGEVECVDIGLAYLLEKKSQNHRRPSIASLHTFEKKLLSILSFLEKHYSNSTRPLSVNTVKALLFIQETNPGFINVSFLIGKYDKIKKLAEGYHKIIIKKIISELDMKHTQEEILVSLKFLKAVDLINIKFIDNSMKKLEDTNFIDLLEIKKDIKKLYAFSEIDFVIGLSNDILHQRDLPTVNFLALQENNFNLELKDNVRYFTDLASVGKYNEINDIFKEIVSGCSSEEKINDIAFKIGGILISARKDLQQVKREANFQRKIRLLESLKKVLTDKIFQSIWKNKVVINDMEKKLHSFESRGLTSEAVQLILTAAALSDIKYTQDDMRGIYLLSSINQCDYLGGDKNITNNPDINFSIPYPLSKNNESLKDIICNKMEYYLQKEDLDNLRKLILMLKKSHSFDKVILNKYNVRLLNKEIIALNAEIKQSNIPDEKNIKLKLLNKFQEIFNDAKENQSKWLPKLQNGFLELSKFDAVNFESKNIKSELKLIINRIADTISKKVLSPLKKMKVKSNLKLDLILKLIDELHTKNIEAWVNSEKSLKIKRETLKNLSLQLAALKKQDENIEKLQPIMSDVLLETKKQDENIEKIQPIIASNTPLKTEKQDEEQEAQSIVSDDVSPTHIGKFGMFTAYAMSQDLEFLRKKNTNS